MAALCEARAGAALACVVLVGVAALVGVTGTDSVLMVVVVGVGVGVGPTDEVCTGGGRRLKAALGTSVRAKPLLAGFVMGRRVLPALVFAGLITRWGGRPMCVDACMPYTAVRSVHAASPPVCLSSCTCVAWVDNPLAVRVRLLLFQKLFKPRLALRASPDTPDPQE